MTKLCSLSDRWSHMEDLIGLWIVLFSVDDQTDDVIYQLMLFRPIFVRNSCMNFSWIALLDISILRVKMAFVWDKWSAVFVLKMPMKKCSWGSACVGCLPLEILDHMFTHLICVVWFVNSRNCRFVCCVSQHDSEENGLLENDAWATDNLLSPWHTGLDWQITTVLMK